MAPELIDLGNLMETNIQRRAARIAVILALALGLATPVWATNWQSLGRGTMWATGDSMEACIDLDSVERFDGDVQFAFKEVYASEQKGPGGESVFELISILYIDCSRNEIATLTQDGYDRYGNETSSWANFAWVFTEVVLPEDFEPIPPRSYFDTARIRLCR